MLTLYEKYLFEDLANDFIDQVKNAIKNKPIKRKRVLKDESGQPTYQSFESVVNASGRLSDSLHKTIDDTGISVICLAYIDELVKGKPPSKVNASVFEIEQWMAIKGVDSISSYTVMSNIEEFGTSIFREHQGGDSGLLSDVSFESKLQQVKEKLTLKMVEEISSQITEQFNYAA